jgi:hypothetical protein
VRCPHLLRQCEVAVRFIFIDDSDRSRSDELPRTGIGPLLAYGGVVVDQEALTAYSAGLERLRGELGIPSDSELKWNPSEDPFLKGKWKLIRQVREEMLHFAISLNIRSIVVIWDRGRVSWDESRVQKELLKYLYERISYCLASLEDVGVVVADQPGGDRSDEKRWLANSLQLTNYGTEYVNPDRVVLPIVTTRSDHVPHLQLADLVVSATTAAIAGSPYGLCLVPLLLQLAHKNAYGRAGGAGIKLFPDDLLNLHRWVFGEDTFVTVSTNTIQPLPCRDWSYATNDGLPPAGATRKSLQAGSHG